jgi:hypothetical protein
MPDPDDTSIRVERPAMGISHDDFFRVFPQVLAGALWRREGLSVHVEWPQGGCLVARVSEQKQRQIASLRLPYLDLDFSFTGVGAADCARFMQHFDRAFHKGGG